MNYGIYKNSRNASWQCLVDFDIRSLPVNLKSIAEKAGIRIIKNKSVNVLSPSESAVSLCLKGKWHIIYDEEDTYERIRFSIAHELGHIFLGHATAKGYHERTVYRNEQESAADMFAIRLLAPACVLWALDLHRAEDIALKCKISLSAARYRAERMKILYERNKFLTHPMERRVYENFEEYIKLRRNEK